MKTRRKRTNKKVPAKGRLRDMADQLWSLAVKADWDHKCAMCGHRGDLNSHHMIPRQHYGTRYELRNGICLCRRCHQFCPDRSPHQNAAGFIVWLESHYATGAEFYFNTLDLGGHKFDGTRNAAYFCDVIRSFEEYVPEEDYLRIVGKRFAEYLEDSH